MLNDLLERPVWKRPEEGKHTIIIKKWLKEPCTNKDGEADNYLACTLLIDNKRELRKNFFENDVRRLANALITKYLEEGQTIPALINTCVDKAIEIDCWIEYRIDDNGREYDNYYWDEDKYNATKVLNTTDTNNTISLGNVSKEDLMNMESLPL